MLLYGPGIDHILESEVSGSVYQHFADAQGSVTKITDSHGTEVKNMTYDSFGNIVAESGGADAEEISYTGRERESEFGLYYYRARYYDPLTGRFMVRDPLGFASGDVNFYRYVMNSPVNYSDPWALRPIGGPVTEASLMPFLNRIANASKTDCSGYYWWDRLERGYYFGTQYGEEAVDYWAQRYNAWESYPLYYRLDYAIYGSVSALWTPETWVNTALTLAFARSIVAQTGGLGAEPIHIGIDLPGGLNIIHYGEHVALGRHIGILFRGPYRALWHIPLP